jgi:hypothetical protein
VGWLAAASVVSVTAVHDALFSAARNQIETSSMRSRDNAIRNLGHMQNHQSKSVQVIILVDTVLQCAPSVHVNM